MSGNLDHGMANRAHGMGDRVHQTGDPARGTEVVRNG